MTEPNIYGTINADGTKVYPPVNIDGAAYTMPCITVNLPGNRFVVVPINFADHERLEALKAPAKTSKGSE